MCIGLVHHFVLSSQIYDIYQPRERRTRRALLICNTKFKHLRQRDGAEVDVKEMTKLLEGLGYNVECHEDKTSQVKGLQKGTGTGPRSAAETPVCNGDGGLRHHRDTSVPSGSASCSQLEAGSPHSWSQVADAPSSWYFAGDDHSHEEVCRSQRSFDL